MALTGFSAISYSLDESFESGIPAEWSQEVVNTATGGAWVLDTLATNPTGASQGTARVALRANEGTNYQVRLITPALDLSSVISPQLSFAYAQVRRSSYSDTLSVYFRTSSSADWVLVRKFETYQNTWSTQTLDLPAAAKVNGCQLAFEGKTNNGYGVVLDNVRVFPKSQCIDAQISGVTVGTTQARVSWAALSGRTFELIVSASAISDLSTYDTSSAVFHSDAITGVSQLVSGLTQATKYYAYLRTDCDDNESGHTNWVSTDFTTSIAFPYSSALAAIPSTWKQYSGAATESVAGEDLSSPSSSYKWTATNNTTVFGAAHLYAQASTNPSWLTTVAIDLSSVAEGTPIALSFKLALTSGSTSATASSAASSAKFHIYVSQNAGVTWSRINTIEGDEMSNVARVFNILLNDYAGESIRLAFVAESGSTSNYFHFGSMSVDVTDAVCLGLRSLKTTKSATSIGLSWNVVGITNNAVAIVSTSATFADTLETKNVSTASASFTGLTPNTTYYLSVRQDCEAGEVLTAVVKTPCEATEVTAETAFSENFNSLDSGIPSCWDNSEGTTTDDSYKWSSYSSGQSGKGLRFNSSYNSSGKTNFLAMPPLQLTVDAALTFYWKNPSGGAGEVLISKDGGDTKISLKNDLTSVSSWTKYEIDLSEYTGEAVIIYFKGTSNYGSSTAYLDLDEVAVTALPACRKVQSAAVKDVTENSAQLSFTRNNATLYEVVVMNKALVADTIAADAVVAFRSTGSNDTVAITGLSDATTYYAYVHSVCGEEYGEWSPVATFTTECGEASLPFVEGFEDYAGTTYSYNGEVPACWSASSTGSVSPHVINSSSSYAYIHGGTKALTFYGRGYNYAVLPRFEAPLNTLELSFWMQTESASNGYLTIGYITAGDKNMNTFDSIAVFENSSSAMVQRYINLSVLPSTAERLVFRWYYSYQYSCCIDDIKVRKIPTCNNMGAVSLQSATSNSATLTFAATNASQYQVVVATKSINPDSIEGNAAVVYNELVSSPQPVIPSLDGDTRYYAYVRGYCGDEGYGDWSSEFSFKTLCDAITPAAFGTETFTAADVMDCWTVGFTTPGTSTASAYAKRDSTKAYGAFLKLSKESVAYTKNAAGVDTVYSDGAYAVSPELDVEDIKTLQINFAAATTSQATTNYKRLNIGVLADPNDFSDIQVVKTIDLDYAADSTALKSYTVSFASTRPDLFGRPIRYVIFQLSQPQKHDSTNYALIDNIYFETASNCEQLVENKIDSIGVLGAAMSWEAYEASEYEVMVSTVNSLRPDTISAPVFTDKVSTNKAVFSGLSANTQYYAYVRAICGAGDTAKWSNSASFRTAVAVPYTEPFSASVFSQGWQARYYSASSAPDSIALTAFSEPSETQYKWEPTAISLPTGMSGYALAAEPASGSSSSAYAWLLSPVVDMTENAADYLELSFKLAGTNLYSYGFVALYISVDGGAYKQLASWKSSNGTYPLDSIKSVAKEYTFNLTKYAGKRVSFAIGTYQYTSSSSSSTPRLLVDDFKVYTYEAVCRGIESIMVAPESESAKVKWEIEGTPVKAAVMISDTANFATYIDSVDVENAYEYTFTNLTPNTQYYARVKQLDCDNAEWAVKSFKTECLPIEQSELPWTEGFESMAIGSSSSDAPECWSILNANDGSYPYIFVNNSSSYVNSGSKSLYFQSSKSRCGYAILPAFEKPLNELVIDFSYRDESTSSSGYLVLGYMTDASDASTFDSIASFNRSTSWVSVIGQSLASIPDSVASSARLAFRYGGGANDNYYLGIDDITVRIIPGCPDMHGLAVDNIVSDSARLYVDDLGAAGYHFIVATAAINVDSLSEADAAKIIVNDSLMGDTTLFVSGLQPATEYYVYARTLCEDNKVGAWSAPVIFRSACGVITIAEGNPYVQNFNALTSGIPACWDNSRGTTTDNGYKWNYYSSGYEGGCLRFNSYSNSDGKTDTLVTPEFFLQDNAKLSFYWKNPTGGAAEIFVSADGGATKTVLESSLTSKYSWALYEKDLSAFTGQTVQIYFASTSNYGSGDAYHYLDNLKIAAIPSCLPVTGVAVDSIGLDSAVVSFKGIEGSTYDVAVASAELDMYHLTAADSAKIAFSVNGMADTATIIRDLAPATTYYVYVRTYCNESAVSEWTDAVTFITECEAIAITKETPWSEDFESYSSGIFAAGCWKNEHVSGSGTSRFSVTTSSNGGNATHQLYLPYMSTGTKTLLTLPAFTLDAANAYTFAIDVYRNTSSYAQEGIRIYASNASTLDATATELAFVSRNYTTASTSGTTAIPAETASNWYTYELLIPLQGKVYIFVQGESQYGSATYMDNFMVSKLPDCKKVTGLAAELTMGDGTVASLSWASDNVAAWVVQYAVAADFANAVSDTISDTTFVALSGLTPEKVYYARVKALCEGDSESEWSDVISFTPTNALSITIADGTTTNDYVPVYGLYVDNYSYSQFIIPADSIAAIQWDSITQLTFYSSNADIPWTGAKFEVYMAEVSSATLSALADWNSLTKVMNAGSLSIKDNKMVVKLDNPYQYTGGNLLIGIKQTVSGTYKSAKWYGKTVTGASYGGYGTSVSQRDFLPKVTFGYAAGEEPACITPSGLKVSDVAGSSAKLSFNASQTPEYEYVVTNAAIRPDTLALVADSVIVLRDTIDTAFVALSNLQPSTDYYVYVRGLCSETEVSAWASAQFATRCLAAIPYSESFDEPLNRKPVYAGTTSYLIPTCWEEGYESTSYVSSIYDNTSSTNYAYSGTSALRLYSYYSESYYYGASDYATYVVLPEMDASLDTLQLTFKARAMSQGSSVNNYANSSYAHSIKIGTMTDPDDYSTFQEIDTYVLAEVATTPSNADGYWEDVTIYLQGAQGKYIALASDFGKSNYVWIDDVEVSRAPDCLAPSAVKVAAGAHAADVQWSSIASEFEVALGAAGFALPTEADTIFAVADTAGLHIADLEPSTEYDLYVRALCGENAASAWSAVASFSTACLMPELAEYNFDDAATRFVHHHDTIYQHYYDSYGYVDEETADGHDVYMENCWLVNGSTYENSASGYNSYYEVYQDTYEKTGYYPSIKENEGSYTYARSASGALEFKYTSNSKKPLVAAMPALEADRDSLQLEFWARPGYESNGSMTQATDSYARMLRVGLMTNPNDLSTFVPFETIRVEALSGAASADSEGENYWRRYRYNLAGTTAPFIAFVYDSTASNTFYVDDIRIMKMATCGEPAAPTIDSITTHSAVIRWDTIAPAYQVALIHGTDTLKQMVVGNDSLLLENLASATTYIVKLRAFCSENDSSEWSASSAFTTECAVISTLPWSENFDGITGSSSEHVLPICWNYINTCTYSSYKMYPTVYPDGYSAYSQSAPNSLYFYSYYSSYSDNDPQDQYAILPQMESISNARMKLAARRYNSSYDATFSVGVMTDPSDASSFVPVATYSPASTTYEEFEIPLHKYTGEGKYIAIKMAAATSSTNRGIYIDDIVIEEVDLNCLGVENLKVSNISENGVQIDFRFMDGLDHDAHVAISKEAAFEEATAILIDTVRADSSYVFNVALDANTLYYIYVRQACGNDEHSEWKSISFRTDCDQKALPWSEDFENLSAGDEHSEAPECWSMLNTNLGHYPNAYVSTSASHAGTQGLYFKSNSGSVDGYMVLPDLAVSANALTVSFWYKHESTSNSGDLEFGYMTDITDEATFVSLHTCEKSTTWGQVILNKVSIPSELIGSIRFAFRYGNVQSSTWYYAAVDDIRISETVTAFYTGEVCEGNDYIGADHGNSFYVEADSCHLGANTFTKLVEAADGSGKPDSLLTLSLTVSAINHYTDSVTVCEGEHFSRMYHGKLFEFDATLNLPTQVRFIENENGCEDVAELFVTVLPKVEEHVYDTITEGETYEWHGENYISTTTATFVTSSVVTGCDSTVYLHLTVNPKPIDPDQAVENIYAQSLIIAPNPVKAGEPIRILNSFAAEALKEARIEIISAAGALVYTQHGAEKPLILPGIPVSGLYTVRIIVGDEIFISSLLVH